MTSIVDSEGTAQNDGLSRDDFLGGRVRLWQPLSGFRSGIDAVLLAACVPARSDQHVLDLGCGAGAAGACLKARVNGVTVTGVEIQPDYASLARRNGIDTVVTADLTALPMDLRSQQFDHVMMNPPYFDRAQSSPGPDAGRETARARDTALSLSDWLKHGAKRLKPKGTLSIVMRAEGLADLLCGLPAPLGSTIVQPLQPRMGRDATLVLIQAIHQGRAALRLRAPLVLHEGDQHGTDGDDFTPTASALLRDAAKMQLRD